MASVPLLSFTRTVFSKNIDIWLSQTIKDLITNNCKWDSFKQKIYDSTKISPLLNKHRVERKISQGIRGFGLRKCRYVGLDKVRLQHILTATAINVIRLFAWFEGVPLAKTRVSSFAKLAPD